MTVKDPVSGWHLLEDETYAYIPRVLPVGWRGDSRNGIKYMIHASGLRVMLSVEKKDGDPRKWLHVSLSREDKLPSWRDVLGVKDLFIGRDKTAIQIFPPVDEYIDHHPNVLHLWCCLNEKILPDFRRFGTL